MTLLRYAPARDDQSDADAEISRLMAMLRFGANRQVERREDPVPADTSPRRSN